MWISAGVAEQLMRQLVAVAKATSIQVLGVVYPKMESDSDIADSFRQNFQ